MQARNTLFFCAVHCGSPGGICGSDLTGWRGYSDWPDRLCCSDCSGLPSYPTAPWCVSYRKPFSLSFSFLNQKVHARCLVRGLRSVGIRFTRIKTKPIRGCSFGSILWCKNVETTGDKHQSTQLLSPFHNENFIEMDSSGIYSFVCLRPKRASVPI